MSSGATIAIAGGGLFVFILIFAVIIYYMSQGGSPSPVPAATGDGGTGSPSGTPAAATGGGGTGSPASVSASPTGGPPSLQSLSSGGDSSASSDGTTPAPINCVVSDWAPYNACTKTCGGGTMTKTRTVVTPASNGGTACPVLTQTDPCNTQECPVDCEVSGWSSFSACSLPCGGGTQTRTRTVTTQPTFSGAACPPLMEQQNCNTQGCPVNCVGSWAGCSVTCGEGVDTYRITTPAANGGMACTEQDGATRKCVQPPCGIDCVGDWVKNTTTDTDGWGACSATCGTGTQARTYKVSTVQVGSGKTCPYPDGRTETRQCAGLSPCPTPVDCVGSFSAWTGCDVGCGGGNQSRTYTITTAAANGGNACPYETGYKETQRCNETPCCSAATVGAWYDVGAVICSGTASATPYIYQSRAVTFPTATNGSATAAACNITVAQTRDTAIGCPAVNASAGSCSDSAVAWSASKGCSLDTPTDASTGTCNPSDVPWSKTAGCTLPSGDVTPSGGTCSITGINWNSTDGCKISPATRAAGSVQCDIPQATWNGTSCIVNPATTTTTSGTCSYGTYNGQCTVATGTGTATDCGTGMAGGGGGQNAINTHKLLNGICMRGTCAAAVNCGKSCTNYCPSISTWYRDDTITVNWTCPANMSKGTTKLACVGNPNSITGLNCPAGYNADILNNRCVAQSSNPQSIDCSAFAGYDPDLANRNCKAKSVTTTDLTCPAGYTKNLSTNKCTPKTATVSDLTCPAGYNKSTSTNKCTAKAATVTSLTCPNLFTSSLSQNKCVPSS